MSVFAANVCYFHRQRRAHGYQGGAPIAFVHSEALTRHASIPCGRRGSGMTIAALTLGSLRSHVSHSLARKGSGYSRQMAALVNRAQ